MVTPIIAALFGSSLHLVSGPTTAISIVVLNQVKKGKKRVHTILS
jgi:SulP family sulfate permease